MSLRLLHYARMYLLLLVVVLFGVFWGVGWGMPNTNVGAGDLLGDPNEKATASWGSNLKCMLLLIPDKLGWAVFFSFV